jgi:hypothetical protein
MIAVSRKIVKIGPKRKPDELQPSGFPSHTLQGDTHFIKHESLCVYNISLFGAVVNRCKGGTFRAAALPGHHREMGRARTATSFAETQE